MANPADHPIFKDMPHTQARLRAETPVIVAFQCTECDAVHCTFEAAAACHHGIGGVAEVKP